MNTRSLRKRLIESLRHAAAFNSNLVVGPEVVLWPDPDRQWEVVVPLLQVALPELLVLGDYAPEKRMGPVIWIKTMVAGQLEPVAGTPIVYLPGMSKQHLTRLGEARLEMQPLLEYLYTGCCWQHRNGKEWTVAAFLQNEEEGLGLHLAQDAATKESLLACLPTLFENDQILFPGHQLNAQFFRNLLLPDILPVLLSWLEAGEPFLSGFTAEKRAIFWAICEEQFGLTPTEALRAEAARRLGQQHNAWRQAWEHFANAPHKYPGIQQLLRAAMPDEQGQALPESSWPQINEAAEARLRGQLAGLQREEAAAIQAGLARLEEEHGKRRHWVWAELQQAPLAQALESLNRLARLTAQSYPSAGISELRHYYETKGYQVDQAVRHTLAAVDSGQDREAVSRIIRELYLPWLETLTEKFQRLAAEAISVFRGAVAYQEQDSFVLFVDALRWELAAEFAERFRREGLQVEMQAGWCALPSLTPTAKPAVSPVAGKISGTSQCTEFRPQTVANKDLSTAHFRDLLAHNGFFYYEPGSAISAGQKYWQEIGDIDTKGHAEGSNMVRRTDELYRLVQESLAHAFAQGIQQVRIVTDHGWLLVPGGLPKAALPKDHAETRWGRCALIKEGAKSDLLQLPWRWNPSVFIAYAPGISFFKANEEYAHGGLSLQECLVPTLIVRSSRTSSGKIARHKWTGLRCRIEADSPLPGYEVDIRTKFSEPRSSIVIPSGCSIADGKCTLIVDDAAEQQAAMIVLLDPSGMIVHKVNTTVGEN
ncbi:MAG: BREX-1 system phosphatase PglZ type B [Bacteroidia bacterium]|nr:BREX-1 system phosphatase PglZ type B [Bacteroidia bacterium]